MCVRFGTIRALPRAEVIRANLMDRLHGPDTFAMVMVSSLSLRSKPVYIKSIALRAPKGEPRAVTCQRAVCVCTSQRRRYSLPRRREMRLPSMSRAKWRTFEANITRCSPRPRCRARRWERDAAVIFSGGGSRCVCVGATRDRDARRPGNEAAPARTRTHELHGSNGATVSVRW